MRINFLGLLARALIQPLYENTVRIRENDNYLIIRPDYAPLIFPLLLRAIFAILGFGFMLVVIDQMLSGERPDNLLGNGVIVLLITLSLLMLLRTTRRMISFVRIPVTIFGKAQQEVTLDKQQRIKFNTITAIRLTHEVTGGGLTIVTVKLITLDTEYRMGSFAYKRQNLTPQLHNLIKTFLSYLLPRSANIADYLIQVDWDKLVMQKGYNADMALEPKRKPI